MKKFKGTALFFSLIIIMTMFTACRDISQEPLGGRVTDVKTTVPNETQEASYTEYVAEEMAEITPAEANITVQAEDCDLNGNLYADNVKKGYSGKGYVTGFYGGKADYLAAYADIPVSQHYDITLCVSAEHTVENSVVVNENDIGPFIIDDAKDKFVTITYYGIYIEQGKALIQINQGSDEFDVDYIEIKNNSDIYEDNFEIESKPVSEKSSYEARDLLRYLKENFNENIITGQFAASGKNKEIDYIYKKTGKYPAIRFGDIGGYGKKEPPLESEIKAAREWDERGGIVGFMWFWNSPSSDSSIYAEETDFDLKKAMTKEDIATLGTSEIQELCRNGKISQECLDLIEDIDKVAEGFLSLAEDGIPILWRPLHSGASGEYWWGSSGGKAYKWLYQLMFDRMTSYHGLDNLIWIWDGQGEDYLVDSSKYDIASVDIYLDPNTKFGSRSNLFLQLKNMTDNKKIIALSESSSVPGIDEMLRDRSMWSFFGLWYGEYLMGDEIRPDIVYTSEEDLVKIYNAENSITLDEYAGIYGAQ